MQIGVIKEIKPKEQRVALTPAGAAALIARGHTVVIEQGAGVGSGFADEAYRRVGAQVVDTASAWDSALVLKVKEPIEPEFAYLGQQIVFTYFHLAGVPWALTEALLAAKTSAVAYETLEDADGRLPLLAPMSAIAGNMAVQMGCHYLASYLGGKGVLLGSVLGRRHGEVLIIGDGVVGSHAARTAIGLGANVSVAGLSLEHGNRLRRTISNDIEYFISNPDTIAERLPTADLVIGAVLAHGARAPKAISDAMVKTLQPGSVIVDVSIDQGGCIATSHATRHDDPVYIAHGVIHYCVSNMPGAYPRTSTLALTDATLPYVLRLADQGLQALRDDAGFAKALNTHRGHIICKPVAEAFDAMGRYCEFQ